MSKVQQIKHYLINSNSDRVNQIIAIIIFNHGISPTEVGFCYSPSMQITNIHTYLNTCTIERQNEFLACCLFKCPINILNFSCDEFVEKNKQYIDNCSKDERFEIIAKLCVVGNFEPC